MGINNPGAAVASPWKLLHDETLAANGIFDVSGISQGYKNLVGMLLVRSTEAVLGDIINVFFNNDTTAANYRRGSHDAGTAHLNGVGDDAFLAGCPGASATADYFGYLWFQIPVYTGGHQKIVLGLVSQRRDATTILVSKAATHWENTAAINRITIRPDGHPTHVLLAGSRFQLWGLGPI